MHGICSCSASSSLAIDLGKPSPNAFMNRPLGLSCTSGKLVGDMLAIAGTSASASLDLHHAMLLKGLSPCLPLSAGR